MGIDCHFLAVPETQFDELTTANPHRAVGQLIRQGADTCDVHKAWHAIHYLLTGTAWEGSEPECYLLQGGEPLGPVDPEGLVEPPRLLNPDQVQAFHRVLEPLDETGLRRRWNHAGMMAAEIYSIHQEDEDEEELDDLEYEFEDDTEGFAFSSVDEAEDYEFVEHFLGGLREFIAKAANSGDGVVVTIG